ncbi:MAG: hypothetical protein RL571_203 [Pseudomonadota bacterium]|jgi:hypothetical protein
MALINIFYAVLENTRHKICKQAHSSSSTRYFAGFLASLQHYGMANKATEALSRPILRYKQVILSKFIPPANTSRDLPDQSKTHTKINTAMPIALKISSLCNTT